MPVNCLLVEIGGAVEEDCDVADSIASAVKLACAFVRHTRVGPQPNSDHALVHRALRFGLDLAGLASGRIVDRVNKSRRDLERHLL